MRCIKMRAQRLKQTFNSNNNIINKLILIKMNKIDCNASSNGFACHNSTNAVTMVAIIL